MSEVGDIEKITQDRVVQLFSEQLGYTYLGNWETRPNNSNIEEPILRMYLKEKRGYSDILINKAIYELSVAAKDLSDGLYAANKKVHDLLRYGVKVKAEAGDNFETVHLIDWKHPLKNEFAIAEEVTISGQHDKRPDIVLFVNGIALGVLELKRSIISIGDGIRQNIVNQQKEFIQSFFSTIQWVFAGNDTQGLRYGTIGTPEKYFLQWKEDSDVTNLLDKYLLKLCEKQRFLEIIYDFTLFDGGIKKLCRTHQYFGVKAAQEHVKRIEGGIIWHTQGSGKSLVMVWLAKWILENNPHARVVVVTDRDELDKQIERVFKDAGEQMVRTTSGKDLMEQLGKAKPRMLCSLVHKFGRKDVDNFNEFIKELEDNPAQTVGELFIFVDECHRTQSGKLHRVMKALLKTAVFIGFTGTPLLKQDKQTSLEVFGKYIHTYKFNEGVEDGVVLDLVYEARDIDQKLTSIQKIDEWFEAKTKGLNDFQKSELKRQWGTMQKVLSSRSRLEKVVSDIIFDFNVKPRLSSGLGNAILVASSIYEACRYFELFQKTELKDKCAIVTSYNPAPKDITTEDTGAGTETEREFIYNLYKALLGTKSTEKYEDEAKAKFIKEPANMKLLVVVDKLLVGFDAPPCSYLYIDKSMQDHALFQAICRVNRLDSEDKQFGYIVDYKDLFKKVENAVAVYTSELDYDTFGQEEVDVLLKDRLEKGKERLDKALEEIALLCEPVEPPRDQMAYIRYFCGNPENEDELKSTETRRTFLYKDTVALIRAYANIAAELEEAGYSQAEIADIKKKVDFYLNLREEIKNASGETLDMKTYEADMRHLIDTYIQAEIPRTISPFANMSLLDIIVNSGIAAAITSLPPGIKNNKEAVAEAIINNVRKKIIKEHLIDPAYFEEMSKLLDEIIKERKANAISYEEYLRKIADLSKKVTQTTRDDLPAGIQTAAQRALFNNTGKNEALAIKLDMAVKKVKKADWRGNTPKENEIKHALNEILKDQTEVERLFAIIKQQSEY
ncbi:type I restriction endonuclease subunit R [Dehalococcoides sp. UCH007]|uniref:type I restriction endonuclease subunit R n=1 Tax=Dehalococcoides sp. UCH007 TaxID=1522671 RepID=UPI0005B56340|nr:HsdR family type I site-specific deoxyribonuclease [Dehalococcoides sp. UCH007]OPX92541.1 MAG: Type-1 restriction enzyme R protein [Pelotomaculum sp. PtaB.Bin104]BAQ34146.1 type I restriction-modification system restriction subunit [Dehalococcoides sp. UCH007]